MRKAPLRPFRRPVPSAPAPFLSLHMAGAGGAVVLPSDEGLIHGLNACLFGWTPAFSPVLPDEDSTLAAIAAEDGGLFRLGSRHLETPMGGLTVTSTVCALIADLSLGYCDALTGGIGLHCAALRVGTGPLMLLAGPHRAGKSTLVAGLAADARVQVFCDDVLPVTSDGQAVALGLAPPGPVAASGQPAGPGRPAHRACR